MLPIQRKTTVTKIRKFKMEWLIIAEFVHKDKKSKQGYNQSKFLAKFVSQARKAIYQQ